MRFIKVCAGDIWRQPPVQIFTWWVVFCNVVALLGWIFPHDWVHSTAGNPLVLSWCVCLVAGAAWLVICILGAFCALLCCAVVASVFTALVCFEDWLAACWERSGEPKEDDEVP